MRTSRLKRIMSFGMALVLTFSLVSAPLTVSAAEEPGGAPVTEATPPPGETQPVPPEESEAAGPTGNPTPEPEPTVELPPEPSAEPTPTPETTPTPEPTPDVTPGPSAIPDPFPTNTPMPEETPIPTEAPLPTETPAPELDMELLALLAASGTYNINTATVALTSPGDYTIAGTGAVTTNTITVSGPGEYTITINNVNIDCSAQPNTCAFSINGGAKVTLTLVGTNTLHSGSNRAGLQVPLDNEVCITGDGSLNAKGGTETNYAGAGIGGGTGQSAGRIEIQSGTVTALGGDKAYFGAAGIGGGSSNAAVGPDNVNTDKSSTSEVVISGGTIVAKGSEASYSAAAGIGGGSYGIGQNITISGGTVTAYGSPGNATVGAAGIGGGCYGDGYGITISGGTVAAYCTQYALSTGAGIGGGVGGEGHDITVSGESTQVNTYTTSADCVQGAGIGGGGDGNGYNLTFTGGTVNINAPIRAAGIGGGSGGYGENITITGGAITVNHNSFSGNDSIHGAGIGGGSGGYGKDITITGGNVTAYGITTTSGNGSRSAGIGGGSNGDGVNIFISGADTLVRAYGGTHAAGIGGGYGGVGINLSITGCTATTNASASGYAIYAQGGTGIGSGYGSTFLDQTPEAMQNVEVDATLPSEAHRSNTNIKILDSNVRCGTTSNYGGSRIGSGNYVNGTEAIKLYVDIDIQDSKVYVSGSYTGIGTYGTTYTDLNVKIKNCPEVIAETSTGIGAYSAQNSTVNIDIQDCTTVRARGSNYSNAAIGLGSGSSYCTATFNIINCNNVTATGESGAVGIGTCGTSYSDININIEKCDQVTAYGKSYYSSNTTNSSPGIGLGYNSDYNTAKINIDGCNEFLTQSDYEAGLGTGYSCDNNELFVMVTNCPVIQGFGGGSDYGAFIGTGSSNTNTNSEFTIRDCGTITTTKGRTGLGTGTSNNGGSFTMNVLDCGDISITNNGYYSTGIGSGYNNYNNKVMIKLERCGDVVVDSTGSFTGDNGWRPGACIGSGGVNYQNDVSVSLLDCGSISASNQSSMCAVIGTGSYNYNNKVAVTIERDGSLEKRPITLEAQHMGACIGRGFQNYASNAAYPAELNISIKNYGDITMSALNSYVTGIGVGYSSYGATDSPLVTNIAIENCGDIVYDAKNQAYNTAIGTGPSLYNTCTTDISIVDSGEISLRLGNGTYNTGIGSGYNNNINTSGGHVLGGSVQIKRCGNVLVSGTGNCQTGIGMGAGNYSNDSNAKVSYAVEISDCGAVTTDMGYYSVGIGIGRGSHRNTSYVGAELTCTVKIEASGNVTATGKHGSVGLGIAGGSNYGMSYNCILDLDLVGCGSIIANGQNDGTFGTGEANGVGIGVQQGYYTSYTNTDHAVQSAIDIIDCGDVTAAGSNYGAAIGSSIDCYNDLGLNITISSALGGHTLTVDSGTEAAAIGSGYGNRNAGRKAAVTISNYTVNAASGGSVALGCGNQSTNGVVVLDLENCTIDATPGKGAAIGLGNKSQGNTKLDVTLTNCTGSLTAKDYGAGIGESANNSATIMELTIDGGTITATGVGGGAGIGGGPIGTACTNIVTIDGDAVVTAIGSSSNKSEYDVNGTSGNPYLDDIAKANTLGAGAGIGGSNNQFGGAITIKSGTVTATGGSLPDYCAAGLGGGRKGDGGTIEILGGDVHATGGACSDCGAAGIGGGVSGHGGKISIFSLPDAASPTTVTAIGGAGEKIGGAGIGGGPRGDGGTIRIFGDVVVDAIGSSRGAGIGGGFTGAGGTVEIYSEYGHDPVVTAIGGLYDSAGIGGGASGSGGTLKLAGAPILMVYGKSNGLAITSALDIAGATVALFQGTMADIRTEESAVTVEPKDGEAAPEAAVTLPANYAAFSTTVPSDGTHNIYLTTDKKYLLATMLDNIEDFDLAAASATEGLQLNVVRFFDVVFESDGGTEIPIQSIRINGKLDIPEPPVKAGSIFAGWYADKERTVPFDFSQTVVADLVVYAKWVEVSGEPYIVYHYKETLEGGWDIGTIEYGGAKPGEPVTATPIAYTGFTEDTNNPNRVATGTTTTGSTLELKLYYKRIIVSVDVENAGADYTPKITAPYGTLVVLSKPTKEGYDFANWSTADGRTLEVGMPIKIETMGDVIYANWVIQEGRAAYQTKHYLRSLEGSYILRVAEDLSGDVGETVSVTPNNYIGFHVNESISSETATGIIQADNSLALRVYYDRDIITVKLLDTYNTPESVSAEYGAAANLPTPSRAGYQFDGWAKADDTLVADGAKIETLGEAVTARWSPAETTAYTVRYYKQSIDGESYEIADLDDLQGATGSTVRAAIKEYAGFTFDADSSTVSGEVRADNRLILSLYYARNTYTVSFDSDGGSAVVAETGIYFTATAWAPEAPTKTGYEFAGWFSDEDRDDLYNFGLPVTQDLTLYAKWDPRDDTAYKVEHYCQDVSGEGYTLTDTDDLTGTTDATVTAAAKTYTGFTEDLDHEDRVAETAVAPDGTTVLRLYYKRDLHSVTFDANGGTAVPKLTGIRYGAAITAPTPPTRTGYTFLRWSGDEDCETAYDFTAAVTADLTLYALWEANGYSVTFNYQGAPLGELPQVKSVDFGAAYGTLPTPAWAGYDFDGWFTHQEEGTEVTTDSVVATAEDHVLYAHWTAHTDTPYIVRHYRQTVDGAAYELVDTDELTGTTGTTATVQAKNYFGFVEDQGHADRVPSGSIAGDGSLVLSLYYARNQHTLKVDPANGQGVDAVRVYYGAAKNQPVEPRRSGFAFTGWTVVGVEVQEDGSYTMPDNDVSFTATWEAIDYSVSYHYTGTVPAGAPELPEGGGSYNIGQVLEVAPVPTMPGYVLYGWTTEDVVVQRGQFTMPDSNVEFTGEWRKANYNVIYVYQGNVPEHAPAAPVDTRTYQVGDTVTVLPAPELAGYTFSGWTTSVEVIDGSFTMPTGNAVLRGTWTPITYEVKFRYEGDMPSAAPALPESTGYRMGDTVAVPPVERVEGFTFRGWSVDGEPVTDGAFTMPNRDIEVVGTWTRNSYPVSYRYEGRAPAKAPAPPAEADHPYEAEVPVAAQPQTIGYQFSGWASNDVTSDPLGRFKMPAGPVSFTGTWSLVDYHISYELGGGIGAENPVSYTIESTAITFAPPSRDGYTFGGWYTDSTHTTLVTGIPAGSAGDLTVYAKWTANTPSGGGSSGGGGGGSSAPTTYTLKFVVNGGTPVASLKAVKNTVVKLADHETTRIGHLFLGWYVDEELTTQALEEFKLTEDTTLYAKWEDLDATLNRAEHMAYIVGFEDGTIRPEANITRAEVAMIFYRLLTAEARNRYDTINNSFADSTDGDWYNTAVSTLASMGVIQGRGADRFDPAAPITRGEFAAIAARFDSEPYEGPDLFDDIVAHWAQGEINRAARKGWVQGDGTGLFLPDALITRAEVVTTINRVLGRMVDADGLPADHREFPDNQPGSWYYFDMLEAAIGHAYHVDETGWERWA